MEVYQASTQAVKEECLYHSGALCGGRPAAAPKIAALLNKAASSAQRLESDYTFVSSITNDKEVECQSHR